jgi:hypothetical protein
MRLPGAFLARVLQAGDHNPNLNSHSRLVCVKNNLVLAISAHRDRPKSAKSLRLRSPRMICYFNCPSLIDPLFFAGLVRAKRWFSMVLPGTGGSSESTVQPD